MGRRESQTADANGEHAESERPGQEPAGDVLEITGILAS